MLKFKGMDGPGKQHDHKKDTGKKGEKYASYFNPLKVSKERFTPKQIKEAADFVKVFATPETRAFLKESQFGNDPLFIEAILGTIARVKATHPETPGLKYPGHVLDDLRSRGHEITAYLEQSIYDTKSKWIQEYGPIQDGLHPLDNLGEFQDTEGFNKE